MMAALGASAFAADITVKDLSMPLSPGDAKALDPDGEQPIDDPLTCLARTIYWEARGDGEEAMRAVAHVVRNRVERKNYPGRYCAVIKQGGEGGPCQFNWWCDGRPDTAYNETIYAKAREIARQVLNGESTDPTGGATMFHNHTVRPDWAQTAQRTAEIGNHTFYRLD